MKKLIKELIPYVVILVIVVLFRTYIATPVIVRGDSMLPNLKDKEMLMNKYSVKTLLIHGSFAKGCERIDSDIDVVVRLNMDLLYEQRINVIKELKEYYTNKFKRFVDIKEANMYLDDTFLKEDNEIKIIINEGEK